MRRKIEIGMCLLGCLFTGLLTERACANLQPITISSSDRPPSPRWMFGEKDKRRASGLARSLETVKRAQLNSQFRSCHQSALPLYGKSSSLAPWIAMVELSCLRQRVEGEKEAADFLASALERIEAKSGWLNKGAQKFVLRDEVIRGRLTLTAVDFRRQRQRAWESIDRLLQIEEWMSVAQKAQLYKLAGELAFIEQKMKAAKNFVLKSLEWADSEELREKLSSIEKALKEETEEPADKPVSQTSLEAQPEEEKLFISIKTSLANGALLSAVEDAVELIRRFPGGKRAEWAGEQILAAYLKVGSGDAKSYFSEQSRMLRQMTKVDGLRQHDWAGTLFDRGHYHAAKEIALSAADHLKPASRSRKVLMLAGQAALASGDVRRASEIFRQVANEHSGSSEALHANFRAGLSHFRLKEYEKAGTFFEKLLVVEDTENLELSARYWLWRSLQKINSPRAEIERAQLIQKFPLTYYGLRAAAEGNDGELQLPEAKPPKQTTKIWLTDSQRQTWRNFQQLLEAGWLEEARLELASLGPIFAKEDKYLMASVWAAALGYRQAILLADDSVDMKARLDHTGYVQLVYPEEFKSLIDKEAKPLGLNVALVRGVIRQESAFQVDAVSRANAVGLMQLMPLTAREAAGRLGLKPFDAEKDLAKPEINIRLGTHYLSHMLDRFSGNVPLALAAYNAGPTRLKRWLQPRELLGRLTTDQTSSPETEVWIEEMPWPETRFYVKSILRNYIVYSMLDKGRVKLSDPIWK